MSSQAQRLAELNKKMIMVAVIDAPGAILFGLGMYAKFTGAAGELHPLLDNPNVITGMLVVGGAIMALGFYKTLSISRERRKILNETAN